MENREGTQGKRIVFVIAHLGPGGAQRVVTDVANALATCDLEFHVVTILDHPADAYRLDSSVRRHRLSDLGDRESDEAVSRLRSKRQPLVTALANSRFVGAPLRIGRGLRYFSRTIGRLRSELKAIAPDIVLSFLTRTNVQTILATRGLSVRILVSERNDPKLQRQKGWLKFLRRWVYRWSDVVTANTLGAVTVLEELLPKAKVAYLPNPVRVPRSREVAEYFAPTFICMARLVHQKGIDVLLRASARVFDVLPGWRLAIIGDGPLRNELESVAHDLGISGTVDWLGYVDDPFPYLRAAQFFVSTSRFEGSPNALLEAMSCGLPAIVTDASPGPLELIGNEEAGLIVPVDNVEATAAATIRLATDGALRSSLGGVAVARVAGHQPEAAIQIWRELLLSTD